MNRASHLHLLIYPMTTSLQISLLDGIIMAIYFFGIAYIGWHFSRQASSTESYFLGGHKLPAWAIGLSMLATSMSSITFLAFPAAAYALDWRLSVNSLTNPIGALLGIFIFVPFFRLKAKTTAFEYLHGRFGVGARVYGSISFLIAQVIRLGSILYLMSLPLTMITGLDPVWIMLFVGVFVSIYTVLGGMSAVVWTDVVQAITLYIGGAATVIVIIFKTPGGLGNLVSTAAADNKFSFGPMHWAWDDRTFWTLFLMGMTQALYAYSADQTVVQRYLAASSEREARKATLVCGALSLPTWLFFTLIGTLLYSFYKLLPDPVVAGLVVDDIFPYFIINVLPVGITGLVLAGLLSAAMSSLSTSLNSFATVLTVDLVRPYLWKDKADHQYAVMARWITLAAALVMIGVALIFFHTEKESFKDLMFRMSAIFGGVMLAFFMLAFFAPHVHKRALWISFAISMLINLYLLLVEWQIAPNLLPIKFHIYWISVLVNASMFFLAVVLSWIIPRPSEREVKA